uniref:Immediate early response 3-interacting protein 1 n=1 Tax=Steinernema glaseri TaxID=37863 RepID=A0A1I7Z1P5_9BILA
MLSFYGLLEASLLVVNGLAIVNRERVLNKIVKNSQYSSFDNQESSVKMQLVNLVIAVQTVMRTRHGIGSSDESRLQYPGF